MHQLSGSGIALQLFNLHIQATELYSFWNKIAQSLLDFNELNPVAFLQNLLEVNIFFKGNFPERILTGTKIIIKWK